MYLGGAWTIATGNVPPLSVQQLVDNDTVNPGWDGELMDNAFVLAEENTTCAEASYSRIATKSSCKDPTCTVDRPVKCHGIQRRVH